MRLPLSCCLLCVFVVGCPSGPEPVTPGAELFGLLSVAQGIDAPTALAAPADGSSRLFIAAQTGTVHVVSAGGALLDTPLLDLRTRLVELEPSYDERGLLGLALHPMFQENGRLFVYYSAPPGAETPAGFDSETRVSEFLVPAGADVADDASERIILRIAQPGQNHKGGQLAFGPDGYLYIGVGDGGGAGDDGFGHTPGLGNAQDRASLLGKILRIDVDDAAPYESPASNPFVQSEAARPEIFALGLRNPWRFGFDHETGRLFAGDVGQSLREEVNLIVAGGNYGWRVREGSTCFNLDNFIAPLADCPGADAAGSLLIDPIIEYDHLEGRSVIGGYVYRGVEISSLRGLYVFGDYSPGFTGNGRVYVAHEDADGEWSRSEIGFAGREAGRLNAFLYGFGRDAAGELYLLTNAKPGPGGGGGVVYRLTP